MDHKDRKYLLKKIKELKKQFKKNPNEHIEFLKDLGVLTPTGKLTKRYKSMIDT